jgi:succinate dehydrogenase / fumarate reductase cytochrome b subunit
VTGIALAVGTLLLVYWLAALAAGPYAFAAAQDVVGSIIGQLLLFGWTVALFYHLCNGIRHLFWDAGRGFELRTAYASGWTVVVATVLLSAIAWIAGYAMMGSGA